MIDDETAARIEYQRGRRAKLLALTPPDREEAQKCLDRIDDMLDRRPRPIAVATDGEIVMDDQSPWVAKQVQIAQNTTGEPERVLTDNEFKELMGE